MSDPHAAPNGSAAPAAPTPPAPTLPTLYSALEPVSAQRHGRLRIREAGFAFAREATAVPLAAEEFVAAARTLPIVFAAQAPHLPVAVTGLAAGHSLYVGEDGQWRHGAYVPAYLRRHPFFLVRATAESDQLVLCLDPKAPQLSETEGDALFAEDGKATLALERALAFCRSVEEAALRTRAMSEGLAEAGLLKPAVVQFEQAGRPIRVDGFYAVDRAALMAVPPEKLKDMRDRGWLEVVYAHLLSIGGLSSLAAEAGVAPQG
jgi:hypothetical protein